MKNKKILSQFDTHLHQLIAAMDLKIRTRHIVEVRHEIDQLKGQQIPREYLVDLANIARRIRYESWGLQLLRPIVRAEVAVQPPPTIKEQTMYAALLIKIGAISEGLRILHDLNTVDHPDVLLYSAYAYLADWDYHKAIPLLKKYIHQSNLDEYQKCIAQVNLAASLVHVENHSESSQLLERLRSVCGQREWILLYSNCLEISAQFFLQQKAWREAEQMLDEAEKTGGQHRQYVLFVEKWRAISKLMQKPLLDSTKNSLEKVRKIAMQQQSWEVLRDCDFYQAVYQKDRKLLTHVYYGTPFRPYQKRIETVFKENNWTLAKEYIWNIAGKASLRTYDLATAAEEGVSEMKPGQVPHRLLLTLTSDFYRPFMTGYLFAKIFPKEYFNSISSPDRIVQAVKKTRQWFINHSIPVGISVDDGQYRLMQQGPYGFLLTKKAFALKKYHSIKQDIFFKKMKSVFLHKSFSIRQAGEVLQLSSSSIRTILNEAHKDGKVFISGRGPSVRYRFQK